MQPTGTESVKVESGEHLSAFGGKAAPGRRTIHLEDSVAATQHLANPE
jgi:hypothetical protein